MYIITTVRKHLNKPQTFPSQILTSSLDYKKKLNRPHTDQGFDIDRAWKLNWVAASELDKEPSFSICYSNTLHWSKIRLVKYYTWKIYVYILRETSLSDRGILRQSRPKRVMLPTVEHSPLSQLVRTVTRMLA